MITFFNWVDQRARLTPAQLALIGERERLTYGELADRSILWTKVLQTVYGLKKGERVAILSANRSEYMLLFLALARLGVVAVPLNIRLQQGELEYQLNDCEPRLLIVSAQFHTLGKALQASCQIPHLLSMDGGDDLPSLQELVQGQAAYQNDIAVDALAADDPFLIMYTSGTTGKPKGAVLTHGNLYWNAMNNLLGLEITSTDRILTILPLFHIGGLGLFALPGFLAGATVVIPDGFTAEKALQIIEEERITIMMGVPTIFQLIRQSSRFADTDLSSLRWFYTGGAPCPLELYQFFWERNIPFTQGFGTTETAPSVFLTPRTHMYAKPGTVGKAVMFCEVKAVDTHGEEVPVGEIGELAVRGPHVFKEYWRRPEATAESFHDGWFYTGDLIKIDEEGFVTIMGRKKEMIISGGENIYPLEVEQVLHEHPALADSVVVGVPDPHWGEVPVAVVVRKEGTNCSGQELHQYAQERLAKYKCPKMYHFVSALPTNATGKIDKRLLQQEMKALY